MSADSHHGTLTANVVTTVTIDAYMAQITVLARGKAAEEVWFTVDGTTPSINGDDVYVTSGVRVVPAPSYAYTTTVKLLSSSAVAYSVIGETS